MVRLPRQIRSSYELPPCYKKFTSRIMSKKVKNKKNKLGRNDICYCGSGLKFKKCCINKMRKSINLKTDNSINSIKKVNFINDSKQLKGVLANKRKTKKQNNHYVPIGYQKRFIPDGQKILYYLRLNPFIDLPDGRRFKGKEIYCQGPGSCFCEDDLYTTKFFGIRNEDIETYLFGKIDGNIHDALNGLISNNPSLLHKYFQYIFEYVDAQKLRTPKGLDWIRSNYFQLTKDELLLEMQFLRTMHCTMWIEGVMEIVSAENSDIKFIISDHPVTIYNYACSPDSEQCQYPSDPLTAWKSSQTIFPLDMNHCLILTNLEYAEKPDEVNPTSGRTNPRFFSQTLTRWDTVIRERKLNLKEVCAINYIIKKRARDYIAAGKEEWLYPEKIYPKNQWKSLRKILLPPKNKVYQFGGEIYVGGKDGGLAWYQDAFGRHHTSREDENNPIRKYSIRKRNEIINNAIWKIFGFDEGKNWHDFRRELADEKIKELYGIIGALWNPDTEITNLLPKPNSNELRAFYHGSLDPRITPITVVGYSLYVDKIIMYSPFSNPGSMKKEYSPYENPYQYREDTIKSIYMMLELMPLIDAGIVEVIPDPCEFNPELRMRTFKMAEARMKYRHIDMDDMDYSHKLMREDMEKSMYSLPPDILEHKIRESSPDISEQEMKEALDYVEKKRAEDPFMDLQPIKTGKGNGRFHIYKISGTHEMALYLAQVTGSFLYTDVRHCWNEHKASELKKTNEKINDNPWKSLENFLNEYNLIMYSNPDPRFWPKIKERGYLKEFIDLYKSVLDSTRTIKDPEVACIKAQEYIENFKKINLEEIFKRIEDDYRKETGGENSQSMNRKILVPASYFFPINGISSNTVTQILLTHGVNTSYWKEVPFSVYLDLNNMKVV